MASTKQPNYSTADETKLRTEYDPTNTAKSVADLADSMGRSARSIISKLVRMGIYVAEEKPAKVAKDNGPTKKELMIVLQKVAPNLNIDGLENTTKDFIKGLIAYFESMQAGEESAAA